METRRLLTVIFLAAIAQDVSGRQKCPCDEANSLKTKAGVKAATSALAAAVGTSVLGTSAIGFTTAGIAGGSLAAFIQANIGVFGGFSLLQSLGATGALALGGPIGLGVAALVGGATYFLATSGSEKECYCEPATEDEYKQLFALKIVASCVEPGTDKSEICNGRGICELTKNKEDMMCSCKPGFIGMYCEISTRKSLQLKDEQFNRCAHPILQGCAKCWLNWLTEESDEECSEDCHVPDELTLKKDDIRPDIGSIHVREQNDLENYEGTVCKIMVKSGCHASIKYGYSHSDNYIDSLILVLSQKEIHCEGETKEFTA